MQTFLFTATERKNASISSTIAVPRSTIEKRILWLQLVTLSWMLVECSIALTAAWKARSVSLLAFGSDSIVELISAAVVLLQFTPRFGISQVRAARFCGILLYGLAGVVSVIALAALFDHLETETSALGMTITGGALLFMPVLARMKRNIAEKQETKPCAPMQCNRPPALIWRHSAWVVCLYDGPLVFTGSIRYRPSQQVQS